MVVGQRALAGLRLGHRHAGRLGQRAQRVGRLGVDRAAAGDDQRPPRGAQPRRRLGHQAGLGHGAPHVPDAPLEQLLRPVERLGLDVLGQRERHGAGLGRIGQHPHRGQQRGRQLLGPVDPVPEARHRPEGVVDRHVVGGRVLELLQHRRGDPGGEDVARQEQHRQPVDRGQRGARDHVGRAGPDRARAGQRGEAVLHPRVARRRVHHPLLVARVVVGHRLGLLEQRLPDAGDVAVPEDPEAARDQPLLEPVALRVLVRQEPDERLRHRQSHRAPVIGSLGSISWSAQVLRIQAWAGSSREAPRALAGPGHHVQVVQVVPRRRHRRAVVAARQQHGIARAHLAADVDPAAVGALVGEAAAGDLEVVDLLERGLHARDLLVVLVGRVGRPVAARRQHLHRDQAVGVERLRSAEVVDLAAGPARAAQLDRHVGRGHVAGGPLPRGARGGEREAAAARALDLQLGVARHVGEVGHRLEDARAAGEREPLVAGAHVTATAQRQHDHLVLARAHAAALARLELDHLQPAQLQPALAAGDGQRLTHRRPPRAVTRPRPPRASRRRRPAGRRRAPRPRCRTASRAPAPSRPAARGTAPRRTRPRRRAR